MTRQHPSAVEAQNSQPPRKPNGFHFWCFPTFLDARFNNVKTYILIFCFSIVLYGCAAPTKNGNTTANNPINNNSQNNANVGSTSNNNQIISGQRLECSVTAPQKPRRGPAGARGGAASSDEIDEALSKALPPQEQALREDNGSVVDALVVYTARVKKHFSDAGGNIEQSINNGKDQLNLSLVNSQINLQVRLVGIKEIPNFIEEYKEEGNQPEGSSGRDLDRIALGSQGQWVREQRDQLHADVVALIRYQGDMDGTSFMLTAPFEYDFDQKHAFFAIRSSCIAQGYYCFAHEFGHIFGCAHDRDNVDVVGLFPNFSYGYAFDVPGQGRFGTMMDYSAANNRIFYFSNPEVKYQGVPTGIAEKNPDGSINPKAADNARTIKASQKYVANYRLSGS